MELIKRYGIFGTIRLIINVLISKLFVSFSVRIVRWPFYVRGNRCIDWGNKLTVGTNLRIDAFTHLQGDNNKNKNIIKFGKNVELNDYVHIAGVNKIEIGNNVLIASKVFITDHSHGVYGNENENSSPYEIPAKRKIMSSKVTIEDNVWLGEHCVVLPGITIGKGSIVGALSLVNRDVPPNCIVGGSPARILKKYNHVTEKWEKYE